MAIPQRGCRAADHTIDDDRNPAFRVRFAPSFRKINEFHCKFANIR